MGGKQPDNTPNTGGRKWRVTIGVALLAIGLGVLGYAYLGPAGQGAPAPPGAEPWRSLLQWANNNSAVVGLIGAVLTALGLLATLWGVFRAATPVHTSSSDQNNTLQTSGEGNRSTAFNQSGQGSHAHTGDIIHNRDPDVERLSREIGQTQGLVRSHLRRLERDGVPPEKWGEALDKIVEEYRKFQAQAEAFQTDDPETKRLIDQGRELADQAKFEEAYQKLDQASGRELKAATDLDRASQNRKTKAAEVLSLKARLKNTEREFREAAELFAKAAGLVRDSEEAHWTYLEQAAEAWDDHGDAKGDNQALSQAIRLYGAILGHYPNRDKPLDWARIQNNLGTVLARLGVREPGAERLDQAVRAYEEALKERTRERVPLDWAATQNNLGISLARLAEREPSAERLEQAVRAYEEALKEYTRERVPLNWAMTQNNLGNALRALGERESSTERLEQAVRAYEEALKECTRERAPLQWAVIQNNLGISLAKSGKREPGAERLWQAVRAFEEALKERTRECVPLQWATTQNNLGTALLCLGEREPGTERLEQAVAAYEEALKERTRERTPLQWATTQSNLGLALRELGMRKSDVTLVQKAVKAQEAALEVAKEAGHAVYIERFSSSLAKSRQALAELQAKAGQRGE